MLAVIIKEIANAPPIPPALNANILVKARNGLEFALARNERHPKPHNAI